LIGIRTRSALSVAAGFFVTAAASVAADALMHATGVFPDSPETMSDPLFALASAYRALFTVAGGYTTARLAPDRPMRHAWILAWIGLVAGLAGVVVYYTYRRSRARPGMVRDFDPCPGHSVRNDWSQARQPASIDHNLTGPP